MPVSLCRQHCLICLEVLLHASTCHKQAPGARAAGQGAHGRAGRHGPDAAGAAGAHHTRQLIQRVVTGAVLGGAQQHRVGRRGAALPGLLGAPQPGRLKRRLLGRVVGRGLVRLEGRLHGGRRNICEPGHASEAGVGASSTDADCDMCWRLSWTPQAPLHDSTRHATTRQPDMLASPATGGPATSVCMLCCVQISGHRAAGLCLCQLASGAALGRVASNYWDVSRWEILPADTSKEQLPWEQKDLHAASRCITSHAPAGLPQDQAHLAEERGTVAEHLKAAAACLAIQAAP